MVVLLLGLDMLGWVQSIAVRRRGDSGWLGWLGRVGRCLGVPAGGMDGCCYWIGIAIS